MIGATRIRTNRAGRGFTLVELLVVVLILAILMAVALPLYLNAIADSEKKTCRANMQTIATAIHAARVAARASDYAGYTGSNFTIGNLKDLGAMPACPTKAGSYSATANADGSFTVSCSNGDHGTFTPGKDTQ